MNTIVIDFQPFALDSTLFIFEDGLLRKKLEISSDVEKLSTALVDICYAEKVFDIQINAIDAIVFNLQKLVTKEEMNQYSIKKINIKGM